MSREGLRWTDRETETGEETKDVRGQGIHTQRQTETKQRDRGEEIRTDTLRDRQTKHTKLYCGPCMLYSCAVSVMVESHTKSIKLNFGLV